MGSILLTVLISFCFIYPHKKKKKKSFQTCLNWFERSQMSETTWEMIEPNVIISHYFKMELSD